MEYPGGTGGWGWLWTTAPTPNGNSSISGAVTFEINQQVSQEPKVKMESPQSSLSSQIISVPTSNYDPVSASSLVKQEVVEEIKSGDKTGREDELEKRREANRLRERRRRELMTPEERVKQREQNRERARRRRLEEKSSDSEQVDFWGLLNEDERRRLEREREVRRLGEKRRRERKTAEEKAMIRERHRIQERERRRNMSELEKEEMRMRNRERARQRRAEMSKEDRDKWKEKRRLQERKRRGSLCAGTSAAASSC